MARLLNYPIGLRPNRMRKLAGPRTKGAGQSEGATGWVQTVASPFGARRLEFSFPNIRGTLARRTRGWISAMHGGANATRIRMCDWDGMSLADRGIDATAQSFGEGSDWSNDLPWDNGQPWENGSPDEAVTVAAAADETIISITDDNFGANLGVGDWVGFYPLHFGCYEITESLGDGQFRLDMPLRAAITTSTRCYLNPWIAMRLESESSASGERDAFSLTGLSLIMVEVFDYDVKDYFTDS